MAILAHPADAGENFHVEAAIAHYADAEALAAWARGAEPTVSVIHTLARIDPESIAVRDARLAAARRRGDRLHRAEDPWARPLQPAVHGATASA